MTQVRKDVLNGWKEIAAYLGRDPRTVERWEKQRLLPVRRLPGSGRATVYALTSELDAWLLRPPARESPAPSRVLPEAPECDAPEAQQPFDRVASDAAAPASTSSTSERVDERSDVTSALASRGLLHNTASQALIAVGCMALLIVVAVRSLAGTHPASAAAPEARRHFDSSSAVGVDDLYLRGKFQMERRTPDSLSAARDAFSAATGQDPQYAPGYAGLGMTYLLLREYSTLPDAEAYRRAEQAADAALALNPDLAEAHVVHGFVDYFWHWQSESAVRHFEAALRSDPYLPVAHHWYGSVLLHEGHFAQALRELDTAQRLDPASAAILSTRALALGLSGQRASAEGMLAEATRNENAEGFHNPATLHHIAGMLRLQAADLQGYAQESLLTAHLRGDKEREVQLRAAMAEYQRGGPAMFWRKLLKAEQDGVAGGEHSYEAARCKAQLGMHEDAIRDLKLLYSRHDPHLIGLAIDPALRPLGAEPRLETLRAAMGMERTSTLVAHR